MKKFTLCFIVLVMSCFLIIRTDSYAARYSIDVRDFVFSPSNLPGVIVGDTIHWEWQNGSHTTTSTTIPAGAAAWDHPINSSNLSFDYIPSKAGVYHYKCTPHESMGMVGQFTVLISTGIPENSLVPTITVSPNPVKDIAWLNWIPREGVFIQHLVIYDAGGKMIREVSFSENIMLPARFDLSNVAEGLIVFEFTDNLGRLYIRKAVRKD